MLVAIYARVSTADQSCHMQLHDLREYVARRGWQVFAEYVDTGFSGALAARPELDRLRLFAGAVLLFVLYAWEPVWVGVLLQAPVTVGR
jgi:hypothetical protein